MDFGVKFSARSGTSKPELFHQGLGHACGKVERERVAEVVREWSDGDNIAAHYGFGIDLFCTADCGKNARRPSVLDSDNRKWLREEFGIQFVTLDELAARVGQ